MVGQQVLALPAGVRIPAPQSNQGHSLHRRAPFFLPGNRMSASGKPKLKTKQLVLLGALGAGVVLVLAVLAYLLLGLRSPAITDASLSARPTLSLPTAAVASATPGPPAPQKIAFVARKPINGFSSCTHFGFRGQVLAGNGKRARNVQIVVWSKDEGLLALADVDGQGQYSLRLPGRPAVRHLWAQVFQNDVPVSEAVAVDTHLNCETGFQIYQIDWQPAQP